MIRLSLALQGGGAHGAFTWGVLDRLLEEDDLEIAAISGTSAGALNGAALKAGLVAGGRQAARKRLRDLWEEIGDIGDFRSYAWIQPWLPALRFWQEAADRMLPISPQGLMAQFYSPYTLGGAWSNPLEPIVAELDFSQVCAEEGPALFIGATNVRTGKVHVFAGQKITPQALLASACIPTVFQAVEIDGESYWDGGFTGNPSLWPLYGAGLPEDLLIVQVNPLYREHIPDTPLEIQNRVNEISFNASLMSELRSIAFVKRLIAEGRLQPGQMKDVRVHMIAEDGLLNTLSATSKLQPSGNLVRRLCEDGRGAAERFLQRNRDKLGVSHSVDLHALFG
ncbi:patatin-like phospholipase family protein [Xinfangfangia pollutisoli]|uniref:patatin-like phospholipase family protein n=1 Tax=Xinfangfangia pollutisoli TaxID=2865960 RepID=UPI00296F0105|nr:patatin-like phospholipase family protein [Xinfangfangia pollutisoli]